MDTYIGREVGPLRGGVTPAALAPQPPPPGPLPAEGGRKVPPARHEAANLVDQRVRGPHAVGEQHDGVDYIYGGEAEGGEAAGGGGRGVPRGAQ